MIWISIVHSRKSEASTSFMPGEVEDWSLGSSWWVVRFGSGCYASMECALTRWSRFVANALAMVGRSESTISGRLIDAGRNGFRCLSTGS